MDDEKYLSRLCHDKAFSVFFCLSGGLASFMLDVMASLLNEVFGQR
jgi:hypothetical protein